MSERTTTTAHGKHEQGQHVEAPRSHKKKEQDHRTSILFSDHRNIQKAPVKVDQHKKKGFGLKNWARSSSEALHNHIKAEDNSNSESETELRRAKIRDMYKRTILDIKQQYEKFYHQFDPQFQIHIDFEAINEVYDYNYRDTIDKIKQNMIKQMETRTEEIVHINKKRGEDLLEERNSIKKETLEIESEIEKVKESSKDIENIISTQDLNLERDTTEIYSLYQDLKKSIRQHAAEKAEVKDIIEDLLNVTRYVTVERDLEEIEVLFKHSGHDQWTMQLKLQTVNCYLDKDTSMERVNESVSKLNNKYSHLDLVHCIQIADRLSKFALAKEYYYHGEFTVDNLERLQKSPPISIHESSVHENSIHESSVHENSIHESSIITSSAHTSSVHESSTQQEEEKQVKMFALSNTSQAYILPKEDQQQPLPPVPSIENKELPVLPPNNNKPVIDYRQWIAHINTKENCTCLWCRHAELNYCRGQGCLFCRDIKEHKHHCSNNHKSSVLKLIQSKKRCKPCERIHLVEKEQHKSK